MVYILGNAGSVAQILSKPPTVIEFNVAILGVVLKSATTVVFLSATSAISTVPLAASTSLTLIRYLNRLALNFF